MADVNKASKHGYMGTAMARREDRALVRGEARYTDDVALDGVLHVAFLRSPVACGTISAVALDTARAMDAVIAAHDASDLGPMAALSVNEVLALRRPLPFPILAKGRLLSVGQPVAAVLATHPQIAQLAAEAVELDYAETEPPVPETVASKSWSRGDTGARFARAAQVVEVQINHPRLAPSPMEPRAIAVRYHPETDSVTIHQSTQTPHRSRSELARILQVDPERLRVVAPAVGGAFGMKGSIYPEEVFAVWAALRHKRGVKWTATRSEEFLSATHGRALQTTGRLALDEDGKFLALEAEVEAPVGAWLPNSALIPGWNAARILPSGYAIDDLEIATEVRSHSLPPVGIYRGAGRPEANVLIERLIDEAAAQAGRDPLDLRLQNMIRPEDMPHDTITGDRLDSGDYPSLMVIARPRYEEMRARRDGIRADGGIAGVGLAFCLEPSGAGWESARVTLLADGTAEVDSGSSSQGQGRRTAYAQIAADALGLEPCAIRVRVGDTGTCPEGIGALASRSTAIGGSAVLEAAREAVAKRDNGAPYPVTADARYENLGQAWGYGVYLVLAAIDRDTGAMTLLDAHAYDDAGRVVNPALVAGQIRGGFAQGLGEAMMEAVVLDETGQLLTGSFMDYAMPRASDVPPLGLTSHETPSPMNTLGAKGVGEAGTIGAPAAILNAAHDALRPFGVRDLQMPLTPCRIWEAMERARRGVP